MCGFVCVIKRGAEPQPINKNLLRHRGPDFTKETRRKNIIFRHWRLSIIDLSKSSNQPVEDGQYVFVYNGELYNYKDLGEKIFKRKYKSDTLFFYDALKNNLYNKIKTESGFHSFLFYDDKKKILLGARDLFGKKNIFYYISKDLVCFGSEEIAVKSALKKEGVNLKISSKAIEEFLEYRDTFCGNTFFSNIKEIPPGAKFTFNVNKWKLKLNYNWSQYYKKNIKSRLKKNLSIIYPKIRSPIKNKNLHLIDATKVAVKKRFVSDVKVQLALSGGIDSTSIAVLTKKMNLEKFVKKTLTVVSSSRPTESNKAKQTSKFLGLKNISINFDNINFLDELKLAIKNFGGPLSHPHTIACGLLCKQARRNGKVLITGEGADDMFFGYSHHSKKNINSFAFRKFINLNSFFKKIKKTKSRYKKLRAFANLNMENCRDLEFKTHLLSLLRRNDKMSMANSVEIRAPFLDPYLFNLVGNFKNDDKTLKKKKFLIDYLKKEHPNYAKDKKKIGFYVPFDDWFDKNCKNLIIKEYITLAIKFIEKKFGLKLRNFSLIKNRLAWVLLNIGIFIKQN